MSRIIFAAIAIVALTTAVAAPAVTAPPRPLHKVGDHWTPYEPPTTFDEGVEPYIIQPGDTLWDLARKNLGNPFLWPQIWEANTYIRDAHWIYPGDPLIIAVRAMEAPTTAGTPFATEGEGDVVPAVAEVLEPVVEEAFPPSDDSETGELIAIGTEDDLYCFAYLGEIDRTPELTIKSAEAIEIQNTFSTGDIVYLSGGEGNGVHAGKEYFIIAPGRIVRHPTTNAKLGRLMRNVGHLRVLCTQDGSATAEVLSSCDAIAIGSWLEPFEPLPIPMTVLTPATTRCDLPNEKPKGFIVLSKDDVTTFGQDHVVIMDLGEADAVTPGTICTIYRDNPVVGMPRILLGEAAILRTSDHWATAKIINSALPMFVGDRVEVK